MKGVLSTHCSPGKSGLRSGVMAMSLAKTGSSELGR
jgi:hypothetical protein